MSDAEHHRLGAELAGLHIADFAAPTHHHVVLRAMRFHYLDWGVPGRLPVVFLHGGGQTARTWDLVCLALRAQFHCLALDQRGHGDSEWSYAMEYDFDAHAGDIAAFVDHLGLDRFALVGMSMGCLNGLTYAVDHPERVAAFVAVDAGPTCRIEGGRAIIAFRERTRVLDSPDAFVAEALRFNPRRDARLLRQSLLHNLRRLADGRWTWKTDQRRTVDLEAAAAHMESLWARLDALRCPSLVLRGADSDVFLDEHAARFAAALPAGSWARIPDAGHTIQGDNPGALVARLEPFLGAAERPRR